MKNYFLAYKKFWMAFLALSSVILYLFYNALKPARILPIYQPNMVNTELVDTTVQYIRKYHSIPDFSLVNQLGDTITQDTFKDKIYIADFFFTTCLTICPIMTGHMGEIQEVLKDQEDVLLLSHSVTPVRDSVPVLYQYGVEKGVNPKKWHLVTGPKKDIYDLARKSYLVAKDEGGSGPFDLVHTENFVLIDKQKRIRGYYDGTDPAAIQTLLEDLKVLQKTYAEIAANK
ncbi:MAG: SCO family protein [Flavobacteriaceae bacterium]|jgi:protein SCO1/2|nr:SCO family protein [Flavobacteriaceae bacterium]MDG2415708.1 SCO family protein [Flavobacteriaceae bacterium]